MRSRRWTSRLAHSLVHLTGEPDPSSAIASLAAGLIDEADLDGPPFQPHVLASFRGVRGIRRKPISCAARLVPEDNALIIEVNQDHSEGKQNFSILHEVSHTLLPGFSGQFIEDVVTGEYPDSSEEELLCDVGASALVLDARWLCPKAFAAGPSLQTLIDMSRLFDASLQATAWKLADLDLWSCAFVFWEPGLRKVERISEHQDLMPGFEDYGSPKPKFRVARAYLSQSFPYFVPRNKSVDSMSLVAQCSEAKSSTFGVEVFDLGRELGELYSENAFVPYKSGGVIRPRVVSLLLSTVQQVPKRALATDYPLELL